MKTIEKLHHEAAAAGLILVGAVEGNTRRRLYRYPCGHERSIPTFLVRKGQAPKTCGQCVLPVQINPEAASDAYQMILSPSYKTVQRGWFVVSSLLKQGGFLGGSAGKRWRAANGLEWIPRSYLRPLREFDRLGVTLEEVQSIYAASPPKMLEHAVGSNYAKYPSWLVRPKEIPAKQVAEVTRFW